MAKLDTRIRIWYLMRFIRRPFYDARWMGAWLPKGKTKWKTDWIYGYKRLFTLIFLGKASYFNK